MATFFTLVTSAGQVKLANALATSTPLQITHMAVGDGNGNPVTPTEVRTALVRETYRGAVNVLKTDPSNPNYLVAELVVPMESGGYVVREVGLFDVDGTLIAYGNFPDAYKPLLSEGSGRELVVRMVFQVQNAATVQLKIDPTVVLATQAWVLSQVTLAKVSPGGLTGQVLTKTSNADGAASWQYPGSSVVNVNVRPEIQTCAAGQTVFTLATLSTVGVAAYWEGGRVFDLTVLNSTQVQTAQSFPAGTRILFTQNEPNSALPYFGRQTWKKIPTGTTVAAGSFIVPDNAAGAAIYTLPPAPQDGDAIEWCASDTPFSTNAVRFLRNGNTIMDVADDLECVTDGMGGRLVWVLAANTWKIYRVSQAGAST